MKTATETCHTNFKMVDGISYYHQRPKMCVSERVEDDYVESKRSLKFSVLINFTICL